jgi:hypothetical protein
MSKLKKFEARNDKSVITYHLSVNNIYECIQILNFNSVNSCTLYLNRAQH